MRVASASGGGAGEEFRDGGVREGRERVGGRKARIGNFILEAEIGSGLWKGC